MMNNTIRFKLDDDGIVAAAKFAAELTRQGIAFHAETTGGEYIDVTITGY